MILSIPNVLSAEDLAHCRTLLAASEWVDGNVTSGVQSALAKNNLQIPEHSATAQELGELILRKLGSNALFNAAAFPVRVFPPLFNRYDVGMGFDTHIDNAIRYSALARQRLRTDLSSTLFLSDVEDYDGGELVIEDNGNERAHKLAAGSMLLYPSGSLHRVEPITRGSRWASFFWTQSMIRNPHERNLLYRFDQSITLARAELGDRHPSVLGLSETFHNLLRQWAEIV